MAMKTKKTLHDLAFLGGPAAFKEPLHVGRPNIGDRNRLHERINAILDNRWLTNHGENVQALEERIAAFIGVKHCISVCNGTIALELAIRALGMKGEVIIPSFTFIATAHALQWQGIKPVFCDISADGCNIDPLRIEALITPNTTGIIGVHVWGMPCDYESLNRVAQKYELKLMFDAAHAFGCSHRNRKIGSQGYVEVFSFHATKIFNTFEGGAVVTNDDDLAQKIRYMKNFGFSGHDNVIYLGSNGKMSEVSAAMGLTNLESLHEYVLINKDRYQYYKKRFAPLPGFKLLSVYKEGQSNYHYVAFTVDAKEAGLSRDQILKLLHAENVIARRYFYPGCHNMVPYRALYPQAAETLPFTDNLCRRVLVMPTGPSVSEDDIDMIRDILAMALDHHAFLR